MSVMWGRNRKQRRFPEPGDIIMYHKDAGTFSYTDKNGLKIFWDEKYQDDKLFSGLKEVFETEEISEMGQLQIIVAIGTLIARSHRLKNCRLVENTSNHISVALI